MKENINLQFKEHEGQEVVDPKLQLEKLGIPEGVFPEALFQDKEMLEFVLEQLPSIKSSIFMGALAGGGGEVANEERGVQKKTGASKILFKAMDRAIYLKKPELARRVADLAGFNLEDVHFDLWNKFMMTRIHSLGWEYFYDVCKSFDIKEDKINKTIIRSIERDLQYGKKEVIKKFEIYLEHGGSRDQLSADFQDNAIRGLSVLFTAGNHEEVERWGVIFQLSPEQKEMARKQAINGLIKKRKYDKAIILGEENLKEYLVQQFSNHYLSLLVSLSWTEIEKLEKDHSEYISEVPVEERKKALSSGLGSMMKGRGAERWLSIEENQARVASLPDDVVLGGSVQNEALQLYEKMLVDPESKVAIPFIELFRLSQDVREGHLKTVVDRIFSHPTLNRGDLDKLVVIVERYPFLRDLIENEDQQEKILAAIQNSLSSRIQCEKYMGLLKKELQDKLVFSKFEQAILSDDQREFERLGKEFKLFEGIDLRRKWGELKASFNAGFSVYELSRYPFLVSSLINQ
ncbi:MAG: hypothetical protein CL685_02855 [Candidatus Magasanikbacteria bacterium]|nr:hypothetical protein [Candidatus Magasanikbacteria bacterium]|tara:strand:+ start:1047 stop:2600 length:1554 start_codon:yes stop_codon:yes gene_type:complete